MADCAALEMLCTARYRGFESRPLRHILKLDQKRVLSFPNEHLGIVTKTCLCHIQVAGAAIGSVEDGATAWPEIRTATLPYKLVDSPSTGSDYFTFI